MNDKPSHTAPSLSMEEGVTVWLANAREGVRIRYQNCENRIRKSPAASVLGAVAFGYLLRRMPVRAILATQVRVLLALAPPALVLFGAAKLLGILQTQEPAKQK